MHLEQVEIEQIHSTAEGNLYSNTQLMANTIKTIGKEWDQAACAFKDILSVFTGCSGIALGFIHLYGSTFLIGTA